MKPVCNYTGMRVSPKKAVTKVSLSIKVFILIKLRWAGMLGRLIPLNDSMTIKMKYGILVFLLTVSVPVQGQSLFYAGDKERFLKELAGKSIPDIRQELSDASLEAKDLVGQFKSLEGLF